MAGICGIHRIYLFPRRPRKHVRRSSCFWIQAFPWYGFIDKKASGRELFTFFAHTLSRNEQHIVFRLRFRSAPVTPLPFPPFAHPFGLKPKSCSFSCTGVNTCISLHESVKYNSWRICFRRFSNIFYFNEFLVSAQNTSKPLRSPHCPCILLY